MAETPILRALRLARAKGMNQTKFAKAMDVLPQHVTNWKNRGRMPPDYHRRAAEVVGITIDQLLSEEHVDIPSACEPQSKTQTARASDLAARWATESIPDSPGATAYSARVAMEFLRHHAESLTASDRRMVASLVASFIGDVDASESQVDAVCRMLETTAPATAKPLRTYGDDTPASLPPESDYEKPTPRKSTGRRRK